MRKWDILRSTIRVDVYWLNNILSPFFYGNETRSSTLIEKGQLSSYCRDDSMTLYTLKYTVNQGKKLSTTSGDDESIIVYLS